MTRAELFTKHFGPEATSVDLKHPNAGKFFEELNEIPLKDVDRTYCVRRHMFFAATQPIMAKNLTKKEAEKACAEYNAGESVSTYAHYEVHHGEL